MPRQREKIIGVRVTPEEHELITRIAQERNLSIGEFIRGLVEKEVLTRNIAIEETQRTYELLERRLKSRDYDFIVELTRQILHGIAQSVLDKEAAFKDLMEVVDDANKK